MFSKVFIGIDCDVSRSGFAVWRDKELTLFNLRFFEVMHKLEYMKTDCSQRGDKLKVIIEGGWLNTKSNWHNMGHGENMVAKVAKNTGANHQVGKLFVEMCEALDIEYEIRRPQSSKVNAETFKKITKYKGKTNQDARDAGMLVYGL